MQHLDTAKVIAEVHKMPCLWDDSVEEFKDYNDKNKAWEEVTEALYADYRSVDDLERLKMSKNSCFVTKIDLDIELSFLFQLEKYSCGGSLRLSNIENREGVKKNLWPTVFLYHWKNSTCFIMTFDFWTKMTAAKIQKQT